MLLATKLGLARSCDKIKPLYLYYHSAYSTKPGLMLNSLEGLPVTWPIDHVVLRDHVTNLKHIFTATAPVATKLGRMVTYVDGLLLMKLHDPLITWCCKIFWQTKIIMFPIPPCLWLQNMVGHWLPPIKSHNHCITWSCEVMWQIKTIIFPLPQCL